MAKADDAKNAGQIDAGAALSDLVTRLTSGGGQTGTKDYIGFPANSADRALGEYVDPVDTASRARRYQPGAQLLPLMDDWTPQDVRKLQTQLVSAGVLDDDYHDGIWDPTSQEAFAEILGFSNGAGVDWREGLNRYMSAGVMTIGPDGKPVRSKSLGKKRAPLVKKFSNPDDLATLVNDAAQKRIGRALTEDEMQKFANGYNSVEGSTQQAAYNAEVGGGGITDAPTPETAARLYTEKLDPVASTAMNIVPLIQGVNELMRGVQGTTQPLESA